MPSFFVFLAFFCTPHPYKSWFVGNQEELGAHICGVASPRPDLDSDIVFSEFTQMFALGECPECQISLFLAVLAGASGNSTYPVEWKGGSGGSPPGNLKMEYLRTISGRGWHPHPKFQVFLPPGGTCRCLRQLNVPCQM